MVSFDDEIEFIINNKPRRTTCREESLQEQTVKEDPSLSDAQTEFAIIQELAKKTGKKEKIEIPMKLSEEAEHYFLKFFGLSLLSWMKRVGERIDCLLELLPVFEFLSLRETSSSILKKIREYLTNPKSPIKVSMKADILRSLFTTYYSFTKPKTNLTLFDSNHITAEGLVSMVLTSINPEEEFSELMTGLKSILLDKKTQVLEITCLFEQYVSELRGINTSSLTRALINMYYYSVVKHNPVVRENIDKAFTEPVFVGNRHDYFDKKELEAEVKSMLVNIEEMVANARYSIIGTFPDQKENQKPIWSKEYHKVKDSFIRRICNDELVPGENLYDNETSIKEELTLLSNKIDNCKEVVSKTSNALEENMKELTTKVIQIQEYVFNMSKSIDSTKINRDEEFTINILQTMSLSSNVFKCEMVNRFADGDSFITRLCLLNDRELVTGAKDGTISIFDLVEYKRLSVISNPKSKSSALQPIGSNNINLGELLLSSLSSVHVESLLKWDDSTFVSGSSNGSIKIWDSKKNECIATIMHSEYIYSIRKLNDKQFSSASSDCTIKIWDFQERKFLKTLKGHTKNVFCLCVMTEKIFVSGSGDNTIKVWDIDKESSIKTFEGHDDSVMCLCKLSDDQFISGSWDNTLKLW
eukprot:CAMPEP_0170523722 /NCGR_PEP_ID=MMETSP0209-20121228/9145_1 /TAXON_ID=665100 ORGANISM="Litonotus pictus, Strain P1" /NCGR_SAMPLE_ID=MMETSP0209 /ASSEMBLY_ACC=CAM_ASM_000301 /LENGTH=641 /DNA_ID=CAMNT_0010811985 /DNA_START=40 /DNA_END=1962 /DNA_ORIENTATION=-